MKTYTPDQYVTALYIAIDVHGTAFRRDGTPYLGHVLRVAMAQDTVFGQIVGILHDAVEDVLVKNRHGLMARIDKSFGARVATAVEDLTRPPHTTYDTYIKIIATNPDAIPIKLADLRDNMASVSDKKSASLQSRYQKAYDYLTSI